MLLEFLLLFSTKWNTKPLLTKFKTKMKEKHVENNLFWAIVYIYAFVRLSKHSIAHIRIIFSYENSGKKASIKGIFRRLAGLLLRQNEQSYVSESSWELWTFRLVQIVEIEKLFSNSWSDSGRLYKLFIPYQWSNDWRINAFKFNAIFPTKIIW